MIANTTQRNIQQRGSVPEEQDPATLWLAALEQLRSKLARGQRDDFEGTRGLRLDGETLIVAGPPALNRKWARYLLGVLARPVRFESA